MTGSRSSFASRKRYHEIPKRRPYTALRTAAIAALMSLTILSSPDAVTTNLTVNVRVMSFMRIRTQYQIGKLVITDSDVDKGYIDVDSGTRYYVQTNTNRGYDLEFTPLTEIFEKVVVSDGSASREIEKCGGCVHISYSGGRLGEVKDLSYRIYLAKEVRPGTYRWPLAVRFETY